MESPQVNEIKALYQSLIQAWNNRQAQEMADQFTMQGELIGFDGSQVIGRDNIFAHVYPIFADHPTPPFISVVKDVRLFTTEVVRLRAIVGMIPPGTTELNPQLNAHQTLIAVKENDVWRIELFQNTPAQFHGRPDLVEQMTKELSEAVI
ncbi:SgcJ/EcaC family oxidoreductase [Sporosarcina beigongshangi]|uniref:SgcJ/EcaC family oxidoreductase n=1 Tax=Sporosarcina beigongshangi TaxID=2782538 RepID=UPI001939E9A9|nr:SgcJ/EcaC family oxidoreductase [Sporosarcina beigongshangi]